MQQLAKLIVVAGLAACGTTVRYTATNRSPRPMSPRPVDTVEVFTASQPNAPFVEVGIIQGRQSSAVSLDELPDVIQAIRKGAAKQGCDAVLINGQSNEVVGGGSMYATSNRRGTTVTGWSSTSELEGFWGACIMYLGTTTAALPAQ